jgi:hypothetical protein
MRVSAPVFVSMHDLLLVTRHHRRYSPKHLVIDPGANLGSFALALSPLIAVRYQRAYSRTAELTIPTLQEQLEH